MHEHALKQEAVRAIRVPRTIITDEPRAVMYGGHYHTDVPSRLDRRTLHHLFDLL